MNKALGMYHIPLVLTLISIATVSYPRDNTEQRLNRWRLRAYREMVNIQSKAATKPVEKKAAVADSSDEWITDEVSTGAAAPVRETSVVLPKEKRLRFRSDKKEPRVIEKNSDTPPLFEFPKE